MKKKINLTEWEQKVLDDMKGKKVYCKIVSVSRSGMSRKMRFYFIQNEELQNVTGIIAQIAGYSQDKNGSLSVSGCGMDMIFSVLSNFNYAMAQRITGKTIQELLVTKECGERIYDNYYISANRYSCI